MNIVDQYRERRLKAITEYGVAGMKWGITAGRAKQASYNAMDRAGLTVTDVGYSRLANAHHFLNRVAKSKAKGASFRMGGPSYTTRVAVMKSKGKHTVVVLPREKVAQPENPIQEYGVKGMQW